MKASRERAADLAVAFAAFVYAASALLAVPGYMASGDSLYHFDVARKIWAGNLAPDPSRSFPWTIYAEWPVDHHWGFHLLTAPFAAIRDSEIGMKLAAATFFASFLVVLHGVLRRRKVPFAWVWAFASVMVASQDWRYLQLRGVVVMAAFALVFAEVAFFVDDSRRRRIAIVSIAAVSSLSYNGALVLLPLHVAGIVVLFGFERDASRKRLVEPLYTGLGLALGLLVNPYMDRKGSTFRFLFFHVRNLGGESGEHSPFPLHSLASEWIWPVLVVLLALAVVVLVRTRRKGVALDRDQVVYGALTFVFIVLTARAGRMRDYVVPLGFTFLAIVARPWLTARLAPLRGARVGGILVLVMLLVAARQWSRTVDRIPRLHPPLDMFEGARPILEAHAGAPVANLVQGDSSMLLWEWGGVQTAHALAPHFVYYRDRALYDDLKTLRESPDADAQRAALFRLRDCGCRLVSSRDDHAFNAFAQHHPEVARLVFLHGGRLYEIASPKGVPGE